MTTDYGVTFPRLRDAAGSVWRDYTHHAFVEGLREGTLSRNSFLSYLVQDYIFLIHFSRAWALAVTKADSVQDMRVCAETVDALLNHEIDLHLRTCASEGVSADILEAAEEHPANLAYTRYVLDAGHAGDMPELLATLMPCVLGYGEIGLRLGREVTSDHPYRDWITTYAGPEYQTVCRDAGALFDRAVAQRLGPTADQMPGWSRLRDRFVTATRLEVGFWDMGLEIREREHPSGPI